MPDAEFDDEIWMRVDDPSQRAWAAEKARIDAMRNMTMELGVFSVGLGIVIAALLIFGVMISQSPRGDISPLGLAILLVPSLLLVLAGTHVLVMRSKLSVKLAKWIVALAFVGQALCTWNPINWIFSAVCLYLVWRTANRAIQQLDRSNPITQQ
jgi:hypothetical protein